MSYGTALSITLPTVGVTVGPTWATNLNTAIQDIIDVLETKVTPSGMDINADLSFRSGGTSYMATDVKALEFTNQSSTLSAASYPTTLFTTDSDGELYFNDNAGRQVQVTSNGAVNVSTSGGITGSGYGSSSVEVNWDSGSTTYKMRSGSATDDYASVFVNDLKMNDGSGNTLTLAAPSMSADYTLTLPSAVAATNNSVLTMSTAGTVAASATPTITSLTTTAAAVVGTTLSVGTTLAVSGTSTLSDNLTLGANKTITLSGTGYIITGDRTLVIPGCSFNPADDTYTHTMTAGYINNTGSLAVYYAPIVLPVGSIVSNIRWLVFNGASVSSREYGVFRSDLASSTETAIENDTDTTSSSALDFSNATDFEILNSRRYYLRWQARTSGDRVYSCVITYSQSNAPV